MKFALPPKRADNEAILDSAGGIAQAADQHVEVFVKQDGLPADFLQQFKAAIGALDAIVKARLEAAPELRAAWNAGRPFS